MINLRVTRVEFRAKTHMTRSCPGLGREDVDVARFCLTAIGSNTLWCKCDQRISILYDCWKYTRERDMTTNKKLPVP